MTLEQFYIHGKIEEKVERFPMYPLSPYMHSLSPSDGTFVKTDEPARTHQHPRSMVSNRVHSCPIAGLDGCIMPSSDIVSGL